MAVRKDCKRKGCATSPKCDHDWWLDYFRNGTRYRMKVNDYAAPRMADQDRHRISSKQEAKRWEARFIADVCAGVDPRKQYRPAAATNPGELTVADFLDLYFTRYVEAEGLRSADTVKGHVNTLKQHLGSMPLQALEKPDAIQEFKGEYRRARSIATVNRVLTVLRGAINWGRFQEPPLFSVTPFHRFGVTIRVKEETKRDRRILPDEEQALLTGCAKMAGPEHKYVGAAMHDRIIGALETCCRQGEMLRIQNRHVYWDTHQIGIPGAHTKDRENRRIPFDPQGRLATILRRRGALGPNAFVFGSDAGEYQESFKTAWESLLLLANDTKPVRAKHGARVERTKLQEIDLHWHDLRHEGACRLLAEGVDIRIIQLMLGHADVKQTQRYLNVTDEELRQALFVSWERRRMRVVG